MYLHFVPLSLCITHRYHHFIPLSPCILTSICHLFSLLLHHGECVRTVCGFLTSVDWLPKLWAVDRCWGWAGWWPEARQQIPKAPHGEFTCMYVCTILIFCMSYYVCPYCTIYSSTLRKWGISQDFTVTMAWMWTVMDWEYLATLFRLWQVCKMRLCFSKCTDQETTFLISTFAVIHVELKGFICHSCFFQ